MHWRGLSVALILVTSAISDAAIADRWEQECLASADDADAHNFDSRRLLISGRVTDEHVLYCVVVKDAVHEYLVNWPAAQMSYVETQKGILASSFRIGTHYSNQDTKLQIGVNLTPFSAIVPVTNAHAKPVKEIAAGAEWKATTKFYGGLPLSNSSGTYRNVDLEITSLRTASGSCQFEYIDRATNENSDSIKFQLPTAIWSEAKGEGIAGSWAFYRDTKYLSYEYGSGEPQPYLAELQITNDDDKPLASIPFVACSVGPTK